MHFRLALVSYRCGFYIRFHYLANMLTVVKAALVAAVAVQALPASELNARQNSNLFVQSIPFSGSTPPVRRELRQLDSTSMNIFLLGLEAMQALSKDDPKSFYRLAAIHGTNLPWAGVSNGLTRWVNNSPFFASFPSLFLKDINYFE